jgi:hypothetical protein
VPLEKQPAPSQAGMISSAQATKLLMITPQWLRQLATKGYVPRAVKGQYPLVGAVQGYIRWLKDEERRTSKVQADSGLKAARQREVELRIAEKEGRVVDMEDVEAFHAFSMATFRRELSGIPAAVTRDLRLREAIEQAVDGAISRYERRFREAGEALRAGRDPLGTAPEDDA